MILVWSTRLKPIWRAFVRTACRTRTTSSEATTDIVSLPSTATLIPLAVDDAADHRQSLVDIERGADPGQGQTQFDQRDGDRGTHADDHRHGIEHARHAGD